MGCGASKPAESQPAAAKSSEPAAPEPVKTPEPAKAPEPVPEPVKEPAPVQEKQPEPEKAPESVKAADPPPAAPAAPKESIALPEHAAAATAPPTIVETNGVKRKMTSTLRRAAVSAEAYNKHEEDTKKKVVSKSDEAKSRIRTATENNPLFEGLKPNQFEEIIDACEEKPIKTGQIIITQGEPGDNFYVVDSGELQAFLKVSGDEPIQSYQQADSFGELALMYNSPRAATVKCTVDGLLWSLDRNTFRRIIMASNAQVFNHKENFLKSVPTLSPLSDKQRIDLAAAMEEETHEDGEYVVAEGEVADSLYLIIQGEVVCHKDHHELMRLSTGQFFGESALTDAEDEYRKANVVAVGQVKLFKLPKWTFHAMLGKLQDVLEMNFHRKVLDGIALLDPLSESEKQECVDNLTERKYNPEEDILTQGQMGDAFFIIKQGQVTVIQKDEHTAATKVLTELKEGEYFGERGLLKDEPCVATVRALSPVICMAISRAAFHDVLGPLQEIIDRKIKHDERQAARVNEYIPWSELQLHSILGEGSFGRVKLTVHAATHTPYALKCLRKGQLVRFQQVEHVVNEKKVCEMCDHPFILKLAGVFNSQTELFMLLELALGGELFSLLRMVNKFDESQACFYSAIVVSAFSYLHERKICHRDLKPENLLLDKEGYLKLVDMGFAKIVRDRTWTLCGTPEYLAPEIISNKGHNQGADWWTLGILLYEMLVGHPPFVAENQMETYHKIMKGKYKIPQNFPRQAKDLISKLLVHNPSARLGSLKGGSRDVRNHEFFASLDFSKLEAKEIPTPYVPKISNPLDTSNFDEYVEETDDNEFWNGYIDMAYELLWEKEFGARVDL